MSKPAYNSGNADKTRDEKAVEQRRRGDRFHVLHIAPLPQETPPRNHDDEVLRELLE